MQTFDENRHGLNLGEGAAYLLLASENGLKQLNKKPLARITGYANANDAPEGTGSFLAMKGAMNKAGLQASDIDYIQPAWNRHTK
ncbi:MAG: hypothetical protein WDM78_00580 [Puia sp.]